MMLYVRMALYAIGAFIAGQGWGDFDPAAGIITLQIDVLAEVIGGALVFAGTFIAGRIAKARGGNT